MNLKLWRYLIPVSLLLVASAPSYTQENYTRVELGVQYSTARLTDSNLNPINSSGFGGRMDYNFNRRFALESQVDFFPQHTAPLFGVQGGQTLQAVFGVRAKVVQTRHYSVFGLIRPGVFHFTDVLYFPNAPGVTYGVRPETHFVLNLGGGVEYYVTPRWVLRADIEGDPYRVPNLKLSSNNKSPVVVGKIDDTTRFSIGVAYRPGALISNEKETSISGKWDFGLLSSVMFIQREGPADGVRTEPGFGGYASYHLFSYFYADADLLYFPRGTNTSGPHDGGEIVQGLFGIKGGIRRNHMGIFGKARPGFHSYSQALTGVSTSGQYSYARSTNLVLDLGGIVEIYPSERSTLRFEAGDTHIYFNTRNVNFGGIQASVGGGKLQHTIQFIVGYGWRF